MQMDEMFICLYPHGGELETEFFFDTPLYNNMKPMMMVQPTKETMVGPEESRFLAGHRWIQEDISAHKEDMKEEMKVEGWVDFHNLDIPAGEYRFGIHPPTHFEESLRSFSHFIYIGLDSWWRE